MTVQSESFSRGFSVAGIKENCCEVLRAQKHILVQGFVQSSLLLWLYFWSPLDYGRQPWRYIYWQMLFGFAYDFFWQKLYFNHYRLRLFVIPLILSFNLFFWLRKIWLYLPLIAMGIGLRDLLVRRNAYGTRSHVFNPSALALCLAFVMLLFVNPPDYTRSIAVYYLAAPYFDLFLFLMSLLTLWLPNQYAIPLGAFSFVMGVDLILDHFFGYRFFGGLARGSVLIGMTLLVTDPKTSPKGTTPKYCFGLAYGFCIAVCNWFLFLAGQDSFYDKILAVPLLNICSPSFDALAEPLEKRLQKLPLTALQLKFIVIAVYVVVFFLFYQRLEHIGSGPFFLKQRIF